MEKLDFAGHHIEAKKKLSEAYNLLNKREFVQAATLVDEAIVELRLMRTAIRTHIKDTNA